MLFRKQFEENVDEIGGEKLFFLGTTQMPLEGGEKVLRLTGIKLSNGNIRTKVVYNYPLHPGMVTEVPFDKELTAVKFEMFLNDIALEIGRQYPGNKLVDLPLAYLGMPNVSELNDEQAWLMDVIFLTVSGEYEQTRSGFVAVKDYVDQIKDGSLKPESLRSIAITTLGIKGESA